MNEETIQIKQTRTYEVYPPTARIDPTPFFSQTDACQDKLFSHRMLASPLRQYVIEKIKDPLRVALEKTGSLWSYVVLFFIIFQTAKRLKKHVGKVTKENSVYVTTHRLLEHKERFMRLHHHGTRTKMLLAVYDIIIAENEHDPYYQYILSWEAEGIAKDVISGRWPRYSEPPKDLRPYWDYEKEVMDNA